MKYYKVLLEIPAENIADLREQLESLDSFALDWWCEIKEDAEQGDFQTVTLQRSYKDKKDQWATTGSLRVTDLPKTILALQEAYKDLVMNSKDDD